MIGSSHSLFSNAVVPTTYGNRKYLYFIIALANLLSFSVGVVGVWTSPYLPKYLTNDNPLKRPITVYEASWIGSLGPGGAIFGTYVSGILAEKLGRKKSLLLSCAVPLIISYLILINAKTVYLYYLSRFIAGLAISSVFTLVPMYAGEVADSANRGFFCTWLTVFETAGELFTFCIGFYISLFAFSYIAITILLAAMALIIIYLPETPYYLINIGNIKGAELILIKLRSNNIGRDITTELESIRLFLSESKLNTVHVYDLFRQRHLRRAFSMTICLTVLQNFSGILAILFFSQSIFNETGTIIPSQYCSMTIGVVQFLSSFVVPNLIDKLGRRTLLFISSVGMCISEFHLGLYFYLKTHSYDMTAFYWLPVTSLVFFIIFYIIGFGPITWTIIAEIFPPNIKSVAITLSVSIWWTWAFLITKLFSPLAAAIGMGPCFWIFAGNCAVAAIYVLFRVINTKGKTFQEIQQELMK